MIDTDIVFCLWSIPACHTQSDIFTGLRWQRRQQWSFCQRSFKKHAVKRKEFNRPPYSVLFLSLYFTKGLSGLWTKDSFHIAFQISVHTIYRWYRLHQNYLCKKLLLGTKFCIDIKLVIKSRNEQIVCTGCSEMSMWSVLMKLY